MILYKYNILLDLVEYKGLFQWHCFPVKYASALQNSSRTSRDTIHQGEFRRKQANVQKIKC